MVGRTKNEFINNDGIPILNEIINTELPLMGILLKEKYTQPKIDKINKESSINANKKDNEIEENEYSRLLKSLVKDQNNNYHVELPTIQMAWLPNIIYKL